MSEFDKVWIVISFDKATNAIARVDVFNNADSASAWEHRQQHPSRVVGTWIRDVYNSTQEAKNNG